jgi:hypothetical protein
METLPPGFKRRPVTTNRGIFESYKLEELAKYKNVYEKVLLCPDSTIANLTNSFNRSSQLGRSKYIGCCQSCH